MKTKILGLGAFFAVVAAVIVWSPSPASCSSCKREVCQFSSECGPRCYCKRLPERYKGICLVEIDESMAAD